MKDDRVIGIDIGGANTKIASSDGNVMTRYLPLWKGADLESELKRVKLDFKPDHVGVVITGEITDRFIGKKEGVLHIASIVNSVFDCVYFFDVRGRFSREIEDPRLHAASNWVASVDFIAGKIRNCIFVDMGSTTCDIIPIKNGKHKASITDFERLKRGELIYTGVLRTNIAALIKRLNLDGGYCRVSSELYAITADAHIILGTITERDYTCDTPDGRPCDIDSAYDRMARVVLCDIEELGKGRAYEVAKQAAMAQIDELSTVILAHSQHHNLKTVLAAGTGESIIKNAAERSGLSVKLLSDTYGAKISEVFPAFAVANLLQQRVSGDTN
ncbi:MAG TPA: hydantoinase/oxoprolinase family protein [Candidatus Acidoferrales bacterium]|nr:hydantoinase/oxoprolinase family protein [Candidatus Acidoferrales bacterium]